MLIRSIHKEDAAGKPKEGAREVRDVSFCQIPGCAAPRKTGHLMCRTHWFELPENLREQLMASHRAWMAGKQDVRPYLVLRLETIIHVCKLHHMDTTEDEAKLARWRKK
jgi:hypothetical protein